MTVPIKYLKLAKLSLTHPLKVAGTSINLPILKAIADQDAFTEHCFQATTPQSGKRDPAMTSEAIRFVGAECCLLGTDFSQTRNPPPWEVCGKCS